MSTLDSTALQSLHDQMCDVRAFEEVVAEANSAKEVRGLLHLSAGAEAVSVGIASLLAENDRLYSTHRPHGHFVAMGVHPKAVFAELAGRETGLCRGRGGSMHLMSDRAVMATGVVAGTLPIAVGHAMALDPPNLVVVYFGDGAAQNGAFHESLNIAALWKAPVLFACENNGVAEFTTRDQHTVVPTVSAYGQVYGMPTRIVDGADIEAVINAGAELIAGIRAGGGPALLECSISRLRSHYEGDARRLSSSDPDARDPLDRVRATLSSLGHDKNVLEATMATAMTRMREVLEQALADPLPDPSDDLHLVFRRDV